MAIIQAILDAQARLDAAIAANSAKVDVLIAGQGGATVAEQQTVAEAVNASAAAVEATNAKT